MGKIDIGQSVGKLDFGYPFNSRIQRACRDTGIASARDLCLRSKRMLGEIEDLGNKSLRKIEVVLRQYELRPGMTGDELDAYAESYRKETEAAALPPVLEDRDAALWEQRRYETARELFARGGLAAHEAVERADRLIRALRGVPEPQPRPEDYKRDF